MSRADDFHALTAEQWKQLDEQLDQLLELEPDEQARRLERIADRDAATAERLRQLLDKEGQDARLDHHLRNALSYLAEQAPTPSGTRIGAWRLLSRIGSGGMAEVYLAERADGAFERKVALKLLWPGLNSEQAAELVGQERRMLAALDDPRIAALLDGGLSDEGRPWLAMEYVDGQPISERCRSLGLDLSTRLGHFRQVLQAVGLAHRKLIVHGDLKPANVLLTRSGQVKLLDFGIGRMLQPDAGVLQAGPGWKAMSPSWASPEQHRGEAPSPASDIFQLGRLLQAMAEDCKPDGKRRRRELEAMIERATRADPEQRYLSAMTFLGDVDAFLAHRPLLAMSGGPGYRARCFLTRHWASIGLAVFLVLAGSTLLSQQWLQSRELKQRHAAMEAMLGYLQDLLEQSNPHRSDGTPLVSGAFLEQASAQLDERLGGQPEAQARMLNTLGKIHLARHELLLARQRYNDALSLAHHHELEDIEERSLDGLASIGIWTGDYAETERLLRELVVRRSRGDTVANNLAGAQLRLADLLHSRGDYPSALALAREAATSRQRPVWSDRVIGMILRDQGRFAEAEEALLAAYTLEQSRPRPRRATRAELTDHLAMLRMHQGQLAEAEQFLNESSRLRRSFLGAQWDGLLWSRHWEGVWALANGDSDRAAELLDLAVADYQRYFGEDSHLLAFARSDRAWAALAQGRLSAAREGFEAAARRLERMRSSGEHPRLAEPLLGLSLVHLATDRPDRAQASAEHALGLRNGLPEDSVGAMAWRANACRILRMSGGDCPMPTMASAAPQGLDAWRLSHAIDGLCQGPARTMAFCETD
ncbi:serine/threonine-protein kinase [Wenzhouxiangella marina]|uniref:Protein kinase domain-containing protein n=1 Tax=Wenzhouxiangella marina TaxID=1579979 RepID=A0A0K0XSG9_9GAMM|nr:serine/threonine-protein kinase [Wenzhouxiangella marina]AKS40605.1 hypothetical protein WM2015_216 [Wenzhouxiangella marina]MBB6088373.1 serine/threonine protein kinase [Wenzhouxiangella marina]